VFGDNQTLVFVTIDPNSEAPVHSHPEEQMGTIIDGECEFEIDGHRRLLRRGDAYVVPSNVPHGARTGETVCLAIDTFAPPRAALAEAIEELQRAKHEQ
jgi:quercetin dioxygenase-like cupin family protein